jgi:uncharacterized membrane protein
MSSHKLTKSHAHIDGNSRSAELAVQHHSGPLPPADEIAKYELTLPGSAHRIIAMAEIQQVHVLEMQKLQQEARPQILIATTIIL